MTPPNGMSDTDRLRYDEKFRELWDAVDKLRETKQPKINAVLWAPILAYILMATVAAIWGAATLSSEMTALSGKIDVATEQRYKSGDAEKDFALRDERIATNREDIAEQKTILGRIDEGVRSLQSKIDRLNP